MFKSGFWKLVALCLLIVASASATPLIATQGGSIAGRALARAAVTHADHKGSLTGAQKLRLLSAYAKLPMTFESNRGQTANQVKFVSRGPGYSLFLTPTEAVIALNQNSTESKPSAKSRPVAAHGRKPVETGYSVLRISLDDAAKSPTISGLDPLPGKANYFIGNDPRKWHTNLPTYSRVKYHNVYTGIDLIYHGSSQRELEYDFIVAPGADPKSIQLSFKGAKQLVVNDRGDLTVSIAGGEVIERAPIVYQEVDGSRRVLSGRYVKRGARRVGFEVAGYDPRMPLVIDPVLVYSTYLGGNDYDGAAGIAVDSSGNAYLTGNTHSTNFPTTAGALQTTYGGGPYDAFVTKLNATGTALIYSTYLGGSAQTAGADIALDSSGNAYVTGGTFSADFPTTPGAFQTTYGGGVDNAFVTKLNASGSALIYSTFLSGSTAANGFDIAVDTSGNAYVTGYTDSANFPTTPSAFQTTNSGHGIGFVTKLNVSGTALIYSTYLGGTDNVGLQQTTGIALDSSDNAYATGLTDAANFPTTAGAFQTTYGGGQYTGFVTKLNATGTALIYSTYLGGSSGDEGIDIALDSSGNAYVTGHTDSTNFPTTAGAFQTTYGGGQSDAFVTKLNATGTGLLYSTYLGGSPDIQLQATASPLIPRATRMWQGAPTPLISRRHLAPFRRPLAAGTTYS